MPRYEIRLESPDLKRENGDPEFRVVVLSAESKDAAVRQCERAEYTMAAYDLDADNSNDLTFDRLRKKVDRAPEKDAAGRQLSDRERTFAALQARERGLYFIHRQQHPYEIVGVRTLKDRGSA